MYRKILLSNRLSEAQKFAECKPFLDNPETLTVTKDKYWVEHTLFSTAVDVCIPSIIEACLLRFPPEELTARYYEYPLVSLLRINIGTPVVDLIKLAIKQGADVNHPAVLEYLMKGSAFLEPDLFTLLVDNGLDFIGRPHLFFALPNLLVQRSPTAILKIVEQGLDMHVEHTISVGYERKGTALLNLVSILSPDWLSFNHDPPNNMGFIPVIEAMIARGADLTRKDNKGRTAWEIGRHLQQPVRALLALP